MGRARLADWPIPPPVARRIAVVGPCAAGKTTLSERLVALGYDVRQCQQEHSYVPDMWRRISRPEVLVYLDVSHSVSLARRASGPGEQEWQAQQLRLAHAREHCDLYIHTDPLSIEEVYERVQAELDRRGWRARSDH